jgi:hypothetical protein
LAGRISVPMPARGWGNDRRENRGAPCIERGPSKEYARRREVATREVRRLRRDRVRHAQLAAAHV